MALRLDKYLADMGIGTRSQVKQYLKKSQVTVNGEVEKSPDRKVEPGKDEVCFQGTAVNYAYLEYYMFYKPAGCITATQDGRQKTVMDYFPKERRKDLFPVGRLDADTEGLLLITNDGPLCHRLLAPAKHVPKTYYARISGKITQEHVEMFAAGLDIGEEKPAASAKLSILDDSSVLLTITEGRFHQVKRMIAAVGGEVLYLKRISMGRLCLDETLAPGEYRPLTEEEIALLKV